MSRPVAVASLVLAVLSTGLVGCRQVTDLGTTCTLVRKGDTEDQAFAPLLNSEIKVGQEYISFGAVECEHWACVRDADFDAGNVEPGDPAQGYCSAPCIPQDGAALPGTGTCVPADAADEDPESPNFLTCRSVSIDPELLALYREADPEGYRRNFGDSTTPFYCARGNGPEPEGNNPP